MTDLVNADEMTEAEKLDYLHKAQAHAKYHRDVRNNFKLKLGVDILRLRCMLGEAPADIQSMYDEKELLQKRLFKKSDIKDSNLVFITVSPHPGILWDEFHKKIEKLKSKVWMHKYIQVYEQRGESEDEIHGYHTHMLIWREGKSFMEIQREIKNTVKNLIDTKVYSALEIKLVKDDDDNVARLKNYILGVKKDVYKHPKQVIDKVFRDKMNILPYYSAGIPDLCNFTSFS